MNPARGANGQEGERSPYWIDPASPFFTCINVSGGRSSGYMLKGILDAHGGRLPPRTVAVFCNTGRERPETLDFVEAMGREWDVRIEWLEFDHDPEGRGGTRYIARQVTRETASMAGEPFDALLRVGWMPSVTRRVCTSELKIGTLDRWMWQRHGLTKRQRVSAIGFRHDEPARWKPGVYETCRTWFPMVEAGVTAGDVAAFWSAQSFDLGIPSQRGNCDLCYLKPRRNLLETIREEPARADWWAAAEARKGRTFRIGESFADLRAAALAGEADRGAATGEVEAEGLPCFCTD